ncbi:30S ribosomal protein S4 [Chlamydia pecorum]|uniref:Small ribosomal subunit protein uS4 n=2 Tax=Chlamydia pecorum TaxID=85991 RepID=A0AA34RCN6_CHLPE|nr:30S ribosomal protein S4 [Chlamydia pecorum]AEB41317.1 ribosomal protein S4 [Chlamydia pecorum E58]AGW37524.1 30S ribosomal protein S4 [Chlamydia pecorum PV3056/3]AGW38445.1 30S ribosomal protein S4 [Chlamydia pecorum W73]AGW39370.1 30S ribosomal protein S4 [Chlamydia pecorum P787]ETF38670.1 30S ribosomal protein S4 [Chlamydia pecorum VR629]
MARYCGPKNRIARRFGANIFGRSRNPLLKKPHPPGQHGMQRKKKSDYGLQLEEKQKLKACFGMILEKQLVKAFREVVNKGDVAKLFLERFECRLDNMVYRMGFARSIFAAQQLVAHGHVLVNGKRVDRRSFFVRPGMQISLKEKSKRLQSVKDALEAKDESSLPSYISLDKANCKGELLLSPEQDQIEAQLPLPINVAVVCEFLSHRT